MYIKLEGIKVHIQNKKNQIRKQSTKTAMKKLLKKMLNYKRKGKKFKDQRLNKNIQIHNSYLHDTIKDFIKKPTIKKISLFKKEHSDYIDLELEGLMLLYYKENK